MALSISTNSFVGEFAKELVADILLTGDTIASGNISVHPNIKKAEKIQTIKFVPSMEQFVFRQFGHIRCLFRTISNFVLVCVPS